MNIPRSIKAMPWPEAWKREGQQDVAVSLSWPVVDHEKLLVATFRRNRTKKCHGASGADFRIVCSKKRNRAAVQYRDGSRPKRSDGLEQAAERMFVKIHTCYPEISPKDEAALGKWLGCQKSWNHMLPELAAWVECAMEQEEEERRKARGELEDEEVTKLCPDELPSGLVEFIQRRTLAEDRVLLYKKGNVIGTCYMCRKEVHATVRRFRQGELITCPSCGERVVAYLRGSDRYKAAYVQDIIAMQKGLDGVTLFLRQWHLCRDQTAVWGNIAAHLEEVARYAIRGARVAKWQPEKKENQCMNTQRYRLPAWERVKNVTEVYDEVYQFFLPENWKELLRGTSLEYCDLGGYISNRNHAKRNHDTRGNPVRFLIDWARYPAIEKLWKAGYDELIHERICGNWKRKKGTVDWRADTIQNAVHIPLRLLRLEKPGEWDTEKIGRMSELLEVAAKGSITEQDAVELFSSEVEIENIRDAMGHATVHKILKYVAKCVEMEKARMDEEEAEAKVQNKTYRRSRIVSPETYRDYLADCVRLNLNLDDQEVLFPADLEAAHRRTIAQVKYRENKEAWKKFEKQAKKLKAMTWERDGLLIRPAGTPAELTEEGRVLHHCVGGYADRMAEGKTAILFIRRAEAPDTPFYTMEYRDGQVIQCRTSHNATYTADETVKEFVDAWLKWLSQRCEKKKTTTAA